MNEEIVIVGFDVAESHIEIEIADWGVDPLAKTCLSCGALQALDGSIPCGH